MKLLTFFLPVGILAIIIYLIYKGNIKKDGSQIIIDIPNVPGLPSLQGSDVKIQPKKSVSAGSTLIPTGFKLPAPGTEDKNI
jgi:hypothetical protein